MNGIIKEMERYAEANNVPIIEKDSIEFIRKYIKLNKVKSVLELGTAIGYSAILMAECDKNVEVTTIERDEKRYREAVKDVNECALDVNLAGHKYDLIFIDAAKGQYIKFFEKFENYLNPGGIIITDNLNFHGLVNNKEQIESKNVRGLVTKIEKYIDFLKQHEEYVTKFYDIGDGISVSFRKNDENVKNID